MTQVVLGPASAGRPRVLRQAGIEPLVVVSEVDEDALIDSLVDGTHPKRWWRTGQRRGHRRRSAAAAAHRR